LNHSVNTKGGTAKGKDQAAGAQTRRQRNPANPSPKTHHPAKNGANPGITGSTHNTSNTEQTPTGNKPSKAA
jgi:hypothetical protein